MEFQTTQYLDQIEKLKTKKEEVDIVEELQYTSVMISPLHQNHYSLIQVEPLILRPFTQKRKTY